uniref:1-acylglycerol-3-phosphate O-acyltransferase n=1 Tax=Cuphea avigera var. pulcherrima TaxID=83566 RepID=A0A0S1TKB4_9MYRT|nr:microsomal lysophosphatidic acid acyltransferase 2a [Cuphea avigera var. pulcherrima]
MTIASAAVVFLFGILLFTSGLIINLFQAFCSVLVWPLSKNAYRRINRVFAEFLPLEFLWLFHWWAGAKLKLFTDPETFRLMGKEHALVIINHKIELDWMVGWVLGQHLGCLGSILSVAKKSTKFLPVFGWSLWFSEYLFLERNWAKDKKTLKSHIERLKDYPLPFWLIIFVEGTRFTRTKLLAAQQYAASAGLPVPRNVLIPHTKGFVSSVSHMRSFVPAIYDVTVAFPKTSPPPTMLKLFEGHSVELHVHIKRHAMKDLPESEDAVAQWCRDKFVEKDALLDKHNAEDTFSGQEVHHVGRPIKSLLVVISWVVVIIFGALKFLQWSSLLSSWKGKAFSVIGLGTVALLMQILILSSQAERSIPAKETPANLKTELSSSKKVTNKEN